MAVEIVPQKPDTIDARARRFDLRALWRLSAWGGAAAIALAAVAFASQTETGSRRLAALAAADLPARPAATAKIPPPADQQAEVARLQTQVRTLAADRDRLAERVATLEQSIEDITGSIKRQATHPAMPPILSMVPVPTAPPIVAAAPVISPPATTEAKAEKQTEEPPATQKSETPAPPAPAPAQTAEPPREVVPLPPVRVAALPAEPAPPKTEFGVAMASSSNLDVLRLQWAALKANYGPMLAGLRPIAAREQRGAAAQYRLVLGPLPNLAAATKLCVRLTAARAVCHAGKFGGDPL